MKTEKGGNGPSARAAFSNVIAVGGTELRRSSDSRGWTESVWGEPGNRSRHRQRMQLHLDEAVVAVKPPGRTAGMHAPDGQRHRRGGCL